MRRGCPRAQCTCPAIGIKRCVFVDVCGWNVDVSNALIVLAQWTDTEPPRCEFPLPQLLDRAAAKKTRSAVCKHFPFKHMSFSPKTEHVDAN